jgi:acyl-CoA thioester hydrolase
MTLPSYDDVAALPRLTQVVVPAEMGDANGHLNVRHHVALHDDGGWLHMASFGFDPESIEARRRNFFDLEHHVRYLDEVLVGDTVSTRYRTLGRTPKAVHLMSFLLDDTRRTLASTVEIVTVHVDLDTRRTAPIEPADAARLDARIGTDAALPWAAPASGVIGLRT